MDKDTRALFSEMDEDFGIINVPVNRVTVQDIVLSQDDIDLSKALSIFEVCDEGVKNAMWTLCRRPDPAVIRLLQSFTQTSIVNKIAKGVRAEANLPLVQGKASLINADLDRTITDQLEQMLLMLAGDNLNSAITISTNDGSTMNVVKVLQNKTLFDSQFIHSVVLSMSRLSYRNNAKTYYFDLFTGLSNVPGVSFEKFEVIEDMFDVSIDPKNGLKFYFPNMDSGFNAEQYVLYCEAVKNRIILKDFSTHAFTVWSQFCHKIEELRPGFLKLLLVLVYPKIIEIAYDQIEINPIIKDSVDVGLQQIAHVLINGTQDEINDMQNENVSVNRDAIVHFALEIDEKVLENYGCNLKMGYAKTLFEKGGDLGVVIKAEPSLDISDSGISDDLMNQVTVFSQVVVDVGEKLRIVRAQGEGLRDTKTNKSADVFQGEYSTLLMKKWQDFMSVLLRTDRKSLYGDPSVFPFLTNTYGFSFDKIGSVDIGATDFTRIRNKIIIMDLVQEHFDNADDASIPVLFYKRWTAGFLSPSAYLFLFKSISQMMKHCQEFKKNGKNSSYLLRLPYPYSPFLFKLYLKTIVTLNVQFDVMPARKAHDPFFFLLLTSTPESCIVDTNKFLRCFFSLTNYFSAGVLERHRAWEYEIDQLHMNIFRSKRFHDMGVITRPSAYYDSVDKVYLNCTAGKGARRIKLKGKKRGFES